LKLAQKYMILRENQQFYIGQGYPVARKIVLEIGSRFANTGVIKEPEDVFFLRIEEIRKIAKGEKIKDIQKKVIKRREEFEMFRKVDPPLLITKEGPKEMEVGEILKGVGGSPGRVSGHVKIISDISEFGEFEKGEILVAPTTNPSWTPLFLMASAVVTEVGGMLCHGAVVAREYGIPAVLGVKNATSTLKNGQRVTVDGVKGVVYTTK
jgi:pyruvate,water dikinase